MSRSSNYGQNPGFNRIVEGKTYIGFVKNNSDGLRMGRLQVWIPEMGGSPDDSSNWHIVSYASPFGGATSPFDTVENSQNMGGSQQSYGWWAVPPDLENQVLCTFVNGEATKGYWFACVWQQNMNHMVPGIASNTSFKDTGPGGILPPVVEYNKNQKGTNLNPKAPPRPTFEPLHKALLAQGLYTDFERGPTSASARREMPAKVYGLLSPRGNQLYIDDDLENAYIRLRTRNGAQVLIHDTTGYVYINSAKGNSWIEISDVGIDMYSAGPISMRSEQNVNIKADGDVNIQADKNVNIISGESIKTKSGSDTNFQAGTDFAAMAAANLSLKSSDMFNSANTHHTKAAEIFRDALIHDNLGKAADAKEAKEATPVTRRPTHEPFAGHPKDQNQAPKGDPVTPEAVQPSTTPPSNGSSTLTTSGARDSSGAVNSSPVKQKQRLGEGNNAMVEKSLVSDKKVSVGKREIPENINDAITSASAKTGISREYMMAMADQESSFNPNAKAKTSSASGLYQFTDGTWAGMIKKYPQYGYSQADKHDPEAQATMAALYAKENQKTIEKATGRNASNTDLYLGHFLGPGGATKFLTADPNKPATSAVSEASANANASIFYHDPKTKSNPKTVSEVYSYFDRKIESKTSIYRT